MLLRGLVVLGVLACAGCPADDAATWRIVAEKLHPAVLSVWGTSASDVYIVGGDLGDAKGPLAMHFDGASWTRLATGIPSGELWWVYGFANGAVYMGGSGGVILRYQNGAFTQLTTPGLNTVFGIWGASPDDVWAVGGASNATHAFAWRLQGGDTWTEAENFPPELANESLWKMYGRAPNDAWMVGTNAKVVRWDGQSFTVTSLASLIGSESLFTIHADENGYAAVGGFGTGSIVENDGTGWRNTTPASRPSGLVGVCLSHAGSYAVGDDGAVYTRDGSSWISIDISVDVGRPVDQSFHATWVDPTGGVWAVGGDTLLNPPVNGIVMHRGSKLPEISL